MAGGTDRPGRWFSRRRVAGPAMVVLLAGASGRVALAAPVLQVRLAAVTAASGERRGFRRVSCARARSRAARLTAGATRESRAGSATGARPGPTSRSRWTPAVPWPARRSRRSASAATPVCALDSAGAAYRWGGPVGDGTASDSSAVPVAVDTHGALAGKTLVQVGGGGFDACALDSQRAAYCWDNSLFGELGNGFTDHTTVPLPVYAGGSWRARSSSRSASAPKRPAGWTVPARPTAGAGTLTASSATAP
jgi:hypothetical protein